MRPEEIARVAQECCGRFLFPRASFTQIDAAFCQHGPEEWGPGTDIEWPWACLPILRRLVQLYAAEQGGHG